MPPFRGKSARSRQARLSLFLPSPPLFRISGLERISLGSYLPHTGDRSGSDDVCVWTNQFNGDYNVIVLDDSGMTSGQFAVENENHTAQIPLEVRWNGRTGTAGNVEIGYDTAFAATGANTQSTDCSVGGLSANLQVRLRESDLLSAPAGFYSNTLTVIITP